MKRSTLMLRDYTSIGVGEGMPHDFIIEHTLLTVIVDDFMHAVKTDGRAEWPAAIDDDPAHSLGTSSMYGAA